MADFASLFGNSATKSRLGKLISAKSLPHALMLVGEKGSGKHTLATAVAMALNCERATSDIPCMRCVRCKRIKEGNFPDVKLLKRTPGKATIGVEEVRLFKEDMYLSPTEAQIKVYIFEEAELLTPQAQNALLVALEEPPKNVVSILLTSGADKILDTVKSRVQNISMEKFSPAELSEYLTEKYESARLMRTSAPERFSALLMSADGRIGKAVEMLSDTRAKDNEEAYRATLGILRALSSKSSYSEVYTCINSLPRQRQELRAVFESILSAIGDLVAIKHDTDAPLVFFPDKSATRELDGRFSIKRLMALYDTVLKAIEDTDKNANVTALLTSFAVKIKNS